MEICFDFKEPSDSEALSDAALLELCRGKFEGILAADVMRVLRERAADVRSCLQKLRECAVRTASAIRLPSNIFVGSQDRADAYATVCEALILSEPLWSELYVAFAAFSGMETSLQQARAACRMAESCLQAYSERETAEDDRVRAIKRGLQKKIKCVNSFEAKFLKTRDGLQRFCFGIASDFSERVSKIADMEHDGAFCDPAGAVRLFNQLCDAVGGAERLMEALLEGEG